MSTDSILIEGLEFETVIGVYAWEKRIHQRLVLDLEMATNIKPAAHTDELALTLDYAAISNAIMTLAQHQPVELVETLAERIATLVMDDFDVPALKLTLRKPSAVPQAAAVGVRITRGNWTAS